MLRMSEHDSARSRVLALIRILPRDFGVFRGWLCCDINKMEWNNEKELNFMEMYQTEPVLWDPGHRFHKDKKQLHDAWMRISEQVGLEIPELKKKEIP